MNQRVVAFTGISGVGKTTFLNKFADIVAFQHVTGGSLIASARDAAADSRDAMRHADLDENQRLLIRGFALVRDPTAELVIMDGHVVIDDGKGLINISSDVFNALDVTVMMHLEADPDRIIKNRRQDTSRSRPSYATERLAQHQRMSREHAQSIARALNIGFNVVTHDDVAHLAKVLGGEG
ncbi:MAG: AAA family ATPase [Pseudomonadota bacterium]